MRRSMILMVVYALVCSTLPSLSQSIKPYSFSHQTDSSAERSLKTLTVVNEPSTNFVRLFLKGTQLGNESYLLLEASDGAKQELRNKDLEHWNFSSAYFNGNTVKVSLLSGKGDINKVVINAVKVNDGKNTNAPEKNAAVSKRMTSEAKSTSNSDINYDSFPYAAAVGRFTDGDNSYGTGWIAPNGAIVTSSRNVLETDREIIEFNIPPSNDYGSVNHPAPEHQYPVKNRQANGWLGFNFKNKHHYDIENEEDGSWSTQWAILEALPNSTGLRPGERQQQYFQVAENPSSFVLDALTVTVDIFHYGETSDDLLDGTNYRTLKRYVTNLIPSEEYLSTYNTDTDRDDFVLYNKDQGNPTFMDSDTGAPITYTESNVAIGVHNDFYNYAPAVGMGFEYDAFLSELDNLFSPEMVYVDQHTAYETGTGAINKPFRTVLLGMEHAEISGIVNIAKGSYDETMYVTKAMTLSAPVGHVVIGEAGDFTTRKATLPSALFMDEKATDLQSTPEDSTIGFNLKTFPNPFLSNTEVNYSLTKATPVQVCIYDKLGNKIRLLLQEIQSEGSHSVVWDGNHQDGRKVSPGLYVIKIDTGRQSSAVKVFKQ